MSQSRDLSSLLKRQQVLNENPMRAHAYCFCPSPSVSTPGLAASQEEADTACALQAPVGTDWTQPTKPWWLLEATEPAHPGWAAA